MTERRHKRTWFGLRLWHWLIRRFRLHPINWTYVDRVRVCLEIAAFLVGGAWAFYTFVIAENRTYQEGGALASTLEWRRTPDGDCSGEYTVTFHNVSKIPVTISTGLIRVWKMEKFAPNKADEPVHYVKPMELQRLRLMQEETKRFFGTYQPDESDEEGFTFVLSKSEPGPILFELILWDDDGLKSLEKAKMDVLSVPDKDYSRWDNNKWDWPCFEQPKESRPQTSSAFDH